MARPDFKDTHHRYYPRRAYKTPLEKAFRNLPCHREVIWRSVHEEIHATQPIPEKPSRDEMLAVLIHHLEGGCPTCQSHTTFAKTVRRLTR